WVIDFATETGGFTMLVEAETCNGIQVTLDGHEAIQRGPEAITAHRQDQRIQLATLFHDIDSAVSLKALDRGDIFGARKRLGKRRVLCSHQRIEGLRIKLIAELAGFQVDQAG